MSDPLLSRLADDADLPAFLALLQHLDPRDPSPDPARAAAQWQGMLRNPLLQCHVIEVGGELVASCTLVIVPNLTRGARSFAFIENVVTHPAWRRRGLATRVLHAARDAAWEADCYKIMLMTGRQNAATLGFYERAGFERGRKTAFLMRTP